MRKFQAMLFALTFVGTLPLTAAAADEFFDSNGVKIRYVTAGQGEAVVLIHGWMGHSGSWGADLSGNTRLKPVDGLQLIAIDCRGHGKSDKPHDVAKYGPEMAEDVVRLLDHLKIDKAHLVGYSSGAFIAGRVAAKHPERVRSLVFAGQAPVLAPAKAGDFSECESFAQAVDAGQDLGSYIIAITPAGRPTPTEAQAKAIAKFLYDGKDVKAFAAAGRGFINLAVTEEELKKCPAPILFIHGANESNYMKKRVAAVRAQLGRGELKLVEGGDHITTMMRPEFGKTIEAFLRTGKVP